MGNRLFAGIRVTDHAIAPGWYERLFGSAPSFIPTDGEAVREDAAGSYVYIEQQPEDAGHSRHLPFVDDLDAVVAQITARGLAAANTETYASGVRKVSFQDPDGNEFGFGGAAR
jgi:predicted enzyme related to lactoylglutathione lyase